MTDRPRTASRFRRSDGGARRVFVDERIDILVNNAGIIRRADAVDFTEATGTTSWTST
jgi:NAD(P)-dependent dehydrogenase (short-subunit alcohol dehydrogenase family)